MKSNHRAPTPNVSVAALQPLIFVLRERKIDPTLLLKSVGIRIENIANLTYQIPIDQYRKFSDEDAIKIEYNFNNIIKTLQAKKNDMFSDK